MEKSWLSKKRITFLCFFLIWGLQTLLVYLNFTPYKFPNDGSDYVSLADAFLKHGAFIDDTVIPSRFAWGYQNGIAYILVLIKSVKIIQWQLGYTLLTAILWFVALRELFNFCYHYFRSTIISTVITAVCFFQYDVVTTNMSFYNESVYIPLTIFTIINIVRSDFHSTPAWKKILIILFFLFGMFFRYQHAVFVFACFGFSLVFDRKYLKYLIPLAIISALLFLAHIKLLPVSGADSYVGGAIRNIPVGGVYCAVVYVVQQFAWFFFPSRLFGECSVYSLLLGTIVLPSVIAGCLALYQRDRRCFLFFIIFLAFSFLFLFISPCRSDRYALPFNFIILFLAIFGLINYWISIRTIKMMVFGTMIIELLIVSLIAYFYFSGNQRTPNGQVYNFLKVHRAFMDKYDLNQFLLYSQDQRLTYWYTKSAVCNIEPRDCLRLSGKSGQVPVVFFGDKLQLNAVPYLAGCKIKRSYIQNYEHFSAWEVVCENHI